MADAVVLNPPFSCTGAASVGVEVLGQTLRCSPAMAFVLLGFERLRIGGRLVAIVPRNTLDSEKDSDARRLLARHTKLRVVREFEPRAFETAVARTLLIECDRPSSAPRLPATTRSDEGRPSSIRDLDVLA